MTAPDPVVEAIFRAAEEVVEVLERHRVDAVGIGGQALARED